MNANEFLLIVGYKSIAHHYGLPAFSTFKYACKHATLKKTAINSDKDNMIMHGYTICKMDKNCLMVNHKRGGYLVIDGKKLMGDIKALGSSIDTTGKAYELPCKVWSSVDTGYEETKVVCWSDIVVGLFSDGHLGFVKDDSLLMDTHSLKDVTTPLKHVLDQTSALCMFGRGAKVWKDYLIFTEREHFTLVAVNLRSVIKEKKLEQVEHSTDIFAFDIHKSGELISVSKEGLVTRLDLNKLKHQKFENQPLKVQLTEKNAEFQAVGLSDQTTLLASTIKPGSGPFLQKLYMLNKKTCKLINEIDLDILNIGHAFIHSILFVTKKRVEFAVACNFLNLVHLVAIRGKTMQLVAPSFQIASEFMNSYEVFENAVFFMQQGSDAKFCKLDIIL